MSPTSCGLSDDKGAFCRWGSRGTKFRYDPSKPGSRAAARQRGNAQGAHMEQIAAAARRRTERN